LLGIGSTRDFVYRLKQMPEDLRQFEKTLLNSIFKGRDERKLSDLKEKFYTAIPKLKKQLYQEVVDLGFFRRSPEKVRNTYAGLGIGLLFAVVALGVCGLASLSQYSQYVFCVPLSLGASALGMILLARVMPSKTEAGSEAAARWEAFKRYLDDIDKYTNLEDAQDIFERYLPYAIAFGLDKEFIRKFSAVETPAPEWYRPAGPVIIPHARPYPRGRIPQPSSAGDAGRIGRAAPAPREGRPAPSLDGMSKGLSRSLNDMSVGLSSMLNSASRTLGSRPAPKGGGGSGRGWSGGGGGFSGGGSFGGGGGGGGGGGFG
jgi:uncharacterized membrane protein YgcG